MSGSTHYTAVIADMDGVITQTATAHEHAWKATFDPLLRQHNQTPFTHEDYRHYVDGKPRHDGVRDFLQSRNIAVPEGDPSDPPERDTIHGLGTRKNRTFLETIERDGADPFPDAVAAIDRWRRGHLPLAVISASRNCRQILKAAELIEAFDAIVDGQSAQELDLHGKRDLIQEALRRLDANAGRVVLLEDAASGVRAAVACGIGRVVGVVREGSGDDLAAAGAETTVSSLSELRFPRQMPSAIDERAAIQRWRGGRSATVFLDYDGTLTPIVKDPDAADMDDAMRNVVRALAEKHPVAIVSGRDRKDVQERVRLENIYYAGSHGFDIEGPDRAMTNAEADEALPEINEAENRLRDELRPIDGTYVERKRFSVATHYRNVRESERATVDKVVTAIASEAAHLRRRDGKMVIELLPDVDWDKGHAVNWIMDALGTDPGDSLVLYIGDDETDEDAFRVLHGRGMGIRVGEALSATLADYVIPTPSEVRNFLAWMTAH